MLGLIHTMTSRVAAAAVALALSGLPQLVEAPGQPVAHRCHCPAKHGAHEVGCPLCHAAAAGLRKAEADDSSLPPCHRALAAKARAGEGEAAQRRAASGPYLTSSCGTESAKLLPPPAVERYTIPQGHEVDFVESIRKLTATRDLPRSATREPETPPPRGA
jgi:hypothetical protein